MVVVVVVVLDILAGPDHMVVVDILIDLDSKHMDLDILEHLGLLDMNQLVLFHIRLRLDLQDMDQLVLHLLVVTLLLVYLHLFVLLVLLDLALLTHRLWSRHHHLTKR
jgi:hypothetical protein